MKARCVDSSFLMFDIKERFQTGQEYSNLLRTMLLKRVSMTYFDLSEKMLKAQFAILLALLTASLTCVDHLRSLTLNKGRIS